MCPFPYGGDKAFQPVSRYEAILYSRDIKRAFAALFIRSAHKRRFTISARPCPPVSSLLSVCFSLVVSLSWTCSTALLLGESTDRLAECPDRRVVSTTSAKEPRRLARSPRVRLFLRDLIKTEFNRPLDKLPPQYSFPSPLTARRCRRVSS